MTDMFGAGAESVVLRQPHLFLKTFCGIQEMTVQAGNAVTVVIIGVPPT